MPIPKSASVIAMPLPMRSALAVANPQAEAPVFHLLIAADGGEDNKGGFGLTGAALSVR